jgi:predicted transcriptional regulator
MLRILVMARYYSSFSKSGSYWRNLCHLNYLINLNYKFSKALVHMIVREGLLLSRKDMIWLIGCMVL